MKVEPVPAVLKYCKLIKKCHWVINIELCLAVPQPGFCTVPWCLCLPWTWLQARKGNLFIFLQHNWYYSLCPASCPLSSLHFRVSVCNPLLDRYQYVCVCLCIIPKSSEKHVAGMLPVLSAVTSGCLWLSSYLYTYIYIKISRLPIHLALISLCIGKHGCMVILFNICRSVKELSGVTYPCLSLRNRNHSWISHLCLQGHYLMKIKGLLASALSCVFFRLFFSKKTSFFLAGISWEFSWLLSAEGHL